MPEIIKDGTGSGYHAKVSANNRLNTDGVVESFLRDISNEMEQSYYVATGFTDLTTTGNDNAILYFKYTGKEKISIYNIRTCGTATQQWILLKNPTAGTIIDDADPATGTNLHLVSANTLTATIYRASGDGKTFTDGTAMAQWINGTGHSIAELDGSLIISQNESIGLTCKISVAATACVTLLCYEF